MLNFVIQFIVLGYLVMILVMTGYLGYRVTKDLITSYRNWRKK